MHLDISCLLPRHKTKEYLLRPLSQIKRIVIHTTDMECSIMELAEWDIAPNPISRTGCPAITYHDVILPSGAIYHTLPYGETSWHVGNHNSDTVAIALMFKVSSSTGKDTYGPEPIMLNALYEYTAEICLFLGVTPDKVVGHRELKGTGWFWRKGHKKLRKTCPGLKINLDTMREMIAKEMQETLAYEGYYTGKIDGIFGTKSKQALQESLKDN